MDRHPIANSFLHLKELKKFTNKTTTRTWANTTGGLLAQIELEGVYSQLGDTTEGLFTINLI